MCRETAQLETALTLKSSEGVTLGLLHALKGVGVFGDT